MVAFGLNGKNGKVFWKYWLFTATNCVLSKNIIVFIDNIPPKPGDEEALAAFICHHFGLNLSSLFMKLFLRRTTVPKISRSYI